MKAAVITEPKKILEMEVEKPVLQDGEALIKVKYAGICGSDMHLFHGEYKKSPMPIIPGHEFVGELVEIKGEAADGISVGDTVALEAAVACGVCEACLEGHENTCLKLNIIGIHSNGGFAQYVKGPVRNLVKINPDCDIRRAALIEPLAVAYHDLRQSGLRFGQKALVIGSGPIGMLIAMVCRQAGASVVAMSEVNDFRIEFAEKAGFVALNGKDPDFYDKAMALTENKGFDVIFECSGTGIGVNNSIKLAKPMGVIVQVGMGFGEPPINIFDITYREIEMRGVRIHPMKDFKMAADVLNSGVMNDDLDLLITKEFELKDVTEAFRYQEEDQEHFKVIVKMPD